MENEIRLAILESKKYELSSIEQKTGNYILAIVKDQ